MKTLKFKDDLVPLVLSGEKYSTWRLFDDKDIQAGDEINFVNAKSGDHFASAKVIRVLERPLGKIKDEEIAGHEKYDSKEQMYSAFANYYQKPIGPETVVKIIWFELMRGS